MSDIKDWSDTATGNSAAAPDGFPEGMAPGDVNNAARELMAAVRRQHEQAEWIDLGDVPSFATTDSFTISGDVTATYHAGRRVRLTDIATLYGRIAAAAYAAPNTTVTVALDSGALSASLSAVAVGAASGTGGNRSVTPESIGAAPKSLLTDDDGDTRIRVEAAADEDAIRLETGGREVAVFQSLAETDADQILATLMGAESGDNVLLRIRNEGTGAETGAGIAFSADDDGGNVTDLARIEAEASDLTDGSEAADLLFKAMRAGTLTEAFRVKSTGRIGINETDPDALLHITTDVADGATRTVLIESTEPGAAAGPVLGLYRNSGTPAASDELGMLAFMGNSTAPAGVHFAEIVAVALDVTASAEDSRLDFRTILNSARGTRMSLAQGLWMAGATGGDRGIGTINATAVYDDNVQLTDYALDAARFGSIDLTKYDALAPAKTHKAARAFVGRGLMDLDPEWYAAFWREHGRLPAMPSAEEWAAGALSVGQLVQRLWETVEVQAVHIAKLYEAIRA